MMIDELIPGCLLPCTLTLYPSRCPLVFLHSRSIQPNPVAAKQQEREYFTLIKK